MSKKWALSVKFVKENTTRPVIEVYSEAVSKLPGNKLENFLCYPPRVSSRESLEDMVLMRIDWDINALEAYEEVAGLVREFYSELELEDMLGVE